MEVSLKLKLPLTAEDAKQAISVIGTLAGPTLLQQMNASFQAAVGADDDEGVAHSGSADKTGLPWDARIHSGNKTVNQDGSWKRRKGVGNSVVASVEAELRAKTGTIGDIPDFLDRTKNEVPAPPAPAVAPVPPTPAPVPHVPAPHTPVAVEAPNYAGIMSQVGQLMNAKKITMPEYQTLLNDFGLTIATLKDAPHMFEMIKAQLDAKA